MMTDEYIDDQVVEIATRRPGTPQATLAVMVSHSFEARVRKRIKALAEAGTIKLVLDAVTNRQLVYLP